jgi:hypothetical protein
MKLLITLLLMSAAVAACATAPSMALLDWNGFIATFPGDTLQLGEYPGARMKVVASPEAASSIAAGNARFERWCSAHDGKSASTQQLTGSSPAVRGLHDGLSAKVNAERARGMSWTPTVALACVDRDNSREFIAAMLSEPGRPSEVKQVQGKSLDKLTRAFFDKDGAIQFGAVYAKREADRSARVAADSQERDAWRDAETHRLRNSPRVGDRTLNGTIVEIRPPLALIQYDERYRSLGNRPAVEWLRIDELSAPSAP